MGKKITGIIHVGANVGQEIKDYAGLEVPVLWFEPIPHIFRILQGNIKQFPLMKAEQLALGEDIREIEFHESDKNGVSSSPLLPTQHYSFFPFRKFHTIKCQQTTLDTYMATSGNDNPYNRLVLDVQGYELHVLKGAVETLRKIDSVCAEVWFQQLYKDSALKKDIDHFLTDHGFTEVKTNIVKDGLVGNTEYARVD